MGPAVEPTPPPENQTRGPRRAIHGAAAALILLASLCVAGQAEEAAVSVQRFDKVEVLNYPWGWIRWTMNDKLDPDAEMTFGVVYIKPNQENPAHIHPNSAEFLHVVEGSCEHRVGNKWVALKAGDTLRIPKDAPHCARTGKESCRAVIVYNTGRRQFVPVEEEKKP